MNYTTFFPGNTLGRVTPIQPNRPNPSQRVLLPSNLYGLAADSSTTNANMAKAQKAAKNLPKIYEAVKKGLAKIGLGAVSQDRFFDRYFEIKDLLNKAGYTYPDHDKLITDLKIRKTQVVDKKTKGSYADEFSRLFEYAVTRVNYGNPGMGTYWAEYFPFQMANLGNIKNESVTRLKEIVNRFPPGTWKGEEIWYNLQPQSPDAVPTASGSQEFTKKIVNGYSVVVDAVGTVREIRNAAGELINPGSPEYKTVADQTPTVQQAGIDPIVGIGIGVLVLGGMMMAGKSDNKK
jgi:hypothetical protein